MSKITMSAIAAAAGVGIATVDRVLNRRAPVRAQTEQKVLAAAHRLGYRSSHAPLSTQSDGVTLRMGFILLSASYSFYQTLTDALRQQTQPFHPAGSEPLFVWHEIDEVAAVVDSLYRLAEQVEAIGVVALDHPLIRHAIAHVSRQGVRVYALFSDFSPCGHAGYFGWIIRKPGAARAGSPAICCISRVRRACCWGITALSVRRTARVVFARICASRTVHAACWNRSKPTNRLPVVIRRPASCWSSMPIWR